MKNKKISLTAAVSIIVFLLYLSDACVAMAGERTDCEDAVAAVDAVANGTEFIAWMEAHKDSGGSLRLDADIVLDENYDFIPYRADMPPILIDTGNYTVTITGAVSFTGCSALSFQGGENAQTIFRISSGGILYLTGVTMQGTQPQTAQQYMVWQEEGAALVINDCSIAGDIHYADTPVVIESDPVCVVVENGQSVNGVLPSSLKCRLNYQGAVSSSEMLPVVWNMTGTETWQEQRMRFRVQGSYSGAFFLEPPVCMVVYNDYPLTFLDVQARVSRNFYVFRGGYTKPEEYLPITVISEYSFNEKDWVVNEENNVSDPSAVFYMSLPYGEWDTAEYPYIYIRLQWDHDGVPHFSNVLRFAADHLDAAEDRGGNRGGGTAIMDPPKTPQKESVVTAPDAEQSPAAETAAETGTNTKQPPAAETAAETDTNTEQPPTAETTEETGTNTEQPPAAETTAETGTNTKQPPAAETAAETGTNTKQPPAAETAAETDTNTEQPPAVEPQQNISPPQEENSGRIITAAAGFVILSVAAGAVGFGVHAGVFRRLFHAIRKKGL
ncbi:MAG: hypothetical protein NC321_00555 [Clostridium sp.]|nr:hypothetical protein [Clostridium sp.]